MDWSLHHTPCGSGAAHSETYPAHAHLFELTWSRGTSTWNTPCTPRLLHRSPTANIYDLLLTIGIFRILSSAIHKRLLNPTFLPAILRTVRATLFPNNTLGPPRQPPSDDEVLEIKRRCANSLLNLIPSNIAATYFAASDRIAQVRQIEDILSCLDDSYLNKHLIFQIVELLILRLVPELGEQGVCELMDERSVEVQATPPLPPSSVST